MKKNLLIYASIAIIGVIIGLAFNKCGGGTEKNEGDEQDIEELMSDDSGVPDEDIDEGYYAVDLGLSVLWAGCNVGAERSEDGGNQFAWGETATRNNFNDLTSYTFTSEYYTTDMLYDKGVIDDSGQLTAKYDAAAANMGKGWRIPSAREYYELLTQCNWILQIRENIMREDVYGYEIVGPSGNSIFLPCAKKNRACNKSEYWTSTCYGDLENKIGDPYLGKFVDSSDISPESAEKVHLDENSNFEVTKYVFFKIDLTKEASNFMNQQYNLANLPSYSKIESNHPGLNGISGLANFFEINNAGRNIRAVRNK